VLPRSDRLHYNSFISRRIPIPTSHPQHHHQSGDAHPPVAPLASILRASVGQRLVIAALFVAAIWGCIFWAMA